MEAQTELDMEGVEFRRFLQHASDDAQNAFLAFVADKRKALSVKLETETGLI